MDKPKRLYSIQWQQQYTTSMTPWNGAGILCKQEQLKHEVIERLLELNDLALANSVIERVRTRR